MYNLTNSEDIKEFLKETHGCKDGQAWFMNEGIEGPVEILHHMRKKNRWDMANWFLVHLMDRSQCLNYALTTETSNLDLHRILKSAELSDVRDYAITVAKEATDRAPSRGKMQTKLINAGIDILFHGKGLLLDV